MERHHALRLDCAFHSLVVALEDSTPKNDICQETCRKTHVQMHLITCTYVCAYVYVVLWVCMVKQLANILTVVHVNMIRYV